MSSAIELYKRAYEMDYRQGDWQFAETLYRELIERYPYSEEKEYAQVHLERIEKLKRDPNDPDLQPSRRSSGGNALAVLSFIMMLFLVAATSVGGYLLWQQLMINSYNDLVIQGQINERYGRYESARRKYEEAQSLVPQKSLAYQCLAELYLKQKQYKLAEIEGRKWEVSSTTADADFGDFKRRLKTGIEGREGAEE